MNKTPVTCIKFKCTCQKQILEMSKNVFQRQEKIKMWGTGPKLNLRDRNLNTKALLVAKFWWKLSGTLLQFQEKEEEKERKK